VSAREDVLARIRSAHEIAPPPDLAYDDLRRTYRTSSDLSEHEQLELLVDRLLDYKALVRQATPDTLGQTVAAALSERGITSVAVPSELPDAWLSETTVSILSDFADGENELSVDALDHVDGVVTGCSVAVAETGTLVLDGSADQGRRVLTLVPDYHLCIVHADRVVADVPQALARLDATRPLTFISGPSATSDIELNRVEGVHGPRTLEVILVRPLPA
jgi:L-lactate dehydrogenase complex protein LldG